MINGISIFREHFSNFKDQYTVAAAIRPDSAAAASRSSIVL